MINWIIWPDGVNTEFFLSGSWVQSLLFNQLDWWNPQSMFVLWWLSQWHGNVLSGDSCWWLGAPTPLSWAHLPLVIFHLCAGQLFTLSELYSCFSLRMLRYWFFLPSSSSSFSWIYWPRSYVIYKASIVLAYLYSQIFQVQCGTLWVLCIKCFTNHPKVRWEARNLTRLEQFHWKYSALFMSTCSVSFWISCNACFFQPDQEGDTEGYYRGKHHLLMCSVVQCCLISC